MILNFALHSPLNVPGLETVPQGRETKAFPRILISHTTWTNKRAFDLQLCLKTSRQ
jgi:hypothetical protein